MLHHVPSATSRSAVMDRYCYPSCAAPTFCNPWPTTVVHVGGTNPSMVSGHQSASIKTMSLMRHTSSCHALWATDRIGWFICLIYHSSLCVFMGWHPLYTSSFENGDSLYLFLQASRGKFPQHDHRCALTSFWSHTWELCGCGRPVLLSTLILTRMCSWQVYKGSTPQQTTHLHTQHSNFDQHGWTRHLLQRP